MTPAPTIGEIEDALRIVARVVVLHGEAYVPILDRLERELDAARKRGNQRDRAASILASLSREVKTVPAAEMRSA